MRCRLNESAFDLMTDGHRRVGQGGEGSDFSLGCHMKHDFRDFPEIVESTR